LKASGGGFQRGKGGGGLEFSLRSHGEGKKGTKKRGPALSLAWEAWDKNEDWKEKDRSGRKGTRILP